MAGKHPQSDDSTGILDYIEFEWMDSFPILDRALLMIFMVWTFGIQVLILTVLHSEGYLPPEITQLEPVFTWVSIIPLALVLLPFARSVLYSDGVARQIARLIAWVSRRSPEVK